MSLLIGWAIFVVALLFSIMLHELGHFATAKKFGMKVSQFFVGFGRTVWSVRRGETEYGIKALPLGGFVKIIGMTALDDVDPADEPRSFRQQPGWQRVIVMVAGSFMHFALAFFLLIVLAMGVGLANSDTPQIGGISPCVPTNVSALNRGSCQPGDAAAPARQAGIQVNDQILAIGGTRVHSWTQLGTVIRAQPEGKPVAITVRRHGQTLVLHAAPAQVPGRHGGYLGIEVATVFEKLGPVSALTYAGSTFGDTLTGSVKALGHLPSALPDLFAKDRAKTPAGNVSSVVGVGGITAQVVAAKEGWQTKVQLVLLIVISLNIFVGAFNLLPLLPLDGGHLAVVIYERARAWLARLRGRPDPGLVDMRKLIPVSVGVFALLVGFGLLLITADIFNPVHIVQ
ncbi:MAG: site-2 protease family protein [Actinomycetota bacterium]